ncbi:MAG: hypothetical protein NWR99_02730 [Verrucomicrobiales bacterium]|nr:hypothetical protein [Verrucomicrobiales bacterium]
MKTFLFLWVIGLVSLSSVKGDDLEEGMGITFHLRLLEREDDNGTMIPVTKEQVDQTILVIEKRLDAMGVSEVNVAREETRGIVVQLPSVGDKEVENIRATMEMVGKLELREVSVRNDETDAKGRSLAQRVQEGEEIVPGFRAYVLKSNDSDGNENLQPILLNRRTALDGSDFVNVVPSLQQVDSVEITLDEGGTDKMIAFTKNMRPGVDRIAIVLDGEVISAPVVNQVPLGKRFIIQGLQEPGEVKRLLTSLINPLENPIKVVEVITSSPSSE